MGQLLELRESLQGKWIFRGQSCVEWPLRPGIERLDTLPAFDMVDVSLPLRERASLKDFRERARRNSTELPAEHDYFGWLDLFQHYGGITRLLDFSESLDVGLYFAVDQFQNGARVKEGSRVALWAINLEAIVDAISNEEGFPVLGSKSATKDTGIFAALFNRWFEVESQEKPYNAVVGRAQVGLAEVGRVYQPPPEGIIPLWPGLHHERTKAQKALFLAQMGSDRHFFQTLVQLFGDRPAREAVMQIEIVLDTKRYLEIRRQLNAKEIVASRLFPGLDGETRVAPIVPLILRGLDTSGRYENLLVALS